MAKTMQERLEAKLSKDFYEERWRFFGTEFTLLTTAHQDGHYVRIYFSCGLCWLKVRIDADHYGIENSVRMFAGTTAAEDCIRWAAQRAIDIFDTVAARVEPYKDGMRKYNSALRGEGR